MQRHLKQVSRKTSSSSGISIKCTSEKEPTDLTRLRGQPLGYLLFRFPLLRLRCLRGNPQPQSVGSPPRSRDCPTASRPRPAPDACPRVVELDGARQAEAEPLGVLPVGFHTPLAQDFVQFVRFEARELDALGPTREERRQRLETGGYRIETTFDLNSFEQARAAIEDVLANDPRAPAGIVSIKPGDGAIRSLYSRSPDAPGVDVVTQSHRSPGSSFNAFLYLAALEAGIGPRSQYLPSPRKPDWRVPVSIDDALVQGLDPVFATLHATIGGDSVRRLAERVGFSRRRTSAAAYPRTAYRKE